MEEILFCLFVLGYFDFKGSAIFEMRGKNNEYYCPLQRY